ncbi:MAG TPA: hypothetical protein VMU06_19935 [Stellaceae bacterium]|nr:hypothetical protein [Stellaceae bacterium]
MAVRRTASKAVRGKAAKKAPGRGIAITAALAGMTMLAAAALPLCILVLAGLVPAMVAALLDRYRAKYLTRTVGAMNAAGLAPLVLQLSTHGLSMAEATRLLSSPFNWLMMYGGAAVGWALFLAMPTLARTIVDVRADQMQRQLKARAEELVQEWGEEVTGRSAQKR